MSKEVTLWALKGPTIIDYNITETTQGLWDLKLHFQSEFIELTTDSGCDCSTLVEAHHISVTEMGTSRGEPSSSWVQVTRCMVRKALEWDFSSFSESLLIIARGQNGLPKLQVLLCQSLSYKPPICPFIHAEQGLQSLINIQGPSSETTSASFSTSSEF